jgi:hypothetical protein
VIYHSLGYFGDFPNEQFPPPLWTLPVEKIIAVAKIRVATWQNLNHESSQPPLYYSCAALWWHLGKFLNLDGLGLLYWLRFLNPVIVFLLVWVGYFAASIVFPQNLFLRLGVPALTSAAPQTAFYSILNDTLSPLFFGITFIFLLKFWRAETPGRRLGTFLGLSFAATFLTKASNVPLLAVSGIFIGIKIWRIARQEKLRATIPAIATLVICAGVPMALWMGWCKINFGDWLGSEKKIQFLHWMHRPFAEWFHHPIFTPHGFWVFLSGNLETLWQGEILWHRKSLSLPAVDLFYVISSVVLFFVALLNLSPKSNGANPNQRVALWFAFTGVMSALIFFGFLSVIYDFQDCFYPSREHPYFTSGRLMLGALIPFLLLFVFGLDCLLKKISLPAKFTILGALILFMLVSEIITDRPIFSNAYNWYHM